MMKETKKRLNANVPPNYEDKCREELLLQNRRQINSQKVNIKDLSKTVFTGFPFAVYREGKEIFVEAYKEWTHILLNGATGTGKSNGITFDIINIFARSKDKPSMVINDIKGECFSKYSKILESLGYLVRVFNFKNSKRSHCFNPLYSIYNKAKECKILKINNRMNLYNEKYTELTELIQQFADFEVSYQANIDDQTWDAGVRSMVYNFVLRLCEDVINNRPIPVELFTLNTVNQLYQYLCGNNREGCAPSGLAYFKSGEESKKGLAPIINSSEKTYTSFIACYKSLLNTWTSISVLNMTMGMDLTDEVLFGGPVAIFIITREYSSSDFIIAGKIFDWIYNTLSDKADESSKRTLDRKFIFILDEFGNMPVFEMFSSKISLSRSKGIFFCVILQSWAQLKQYNERSTKNGVSNDGQTIIDNCFTTIFYGSPNPNTIEAFCESCGKMTIISAEGIKRGDTSLTQEINCLTPRNVVNLQRFEYYVKIRGVLLKASAIMAYDIFEQNDMVSINELLPKRQNSVCNMNIDFTAKARELPRKSCQEDDRSTCERLNAEYPGLNLTIDPSGNDLYRRKNEEREEQLAQRRDAPLFDSVKNILPLMGFSPSDIHKAELLIDDTTKDKRSSVDNDIKNYRLFSASYASEKNIMKLMESIKEKYEPGKCRCILSAIPRIEFYEDEERTFVFYLNVLSKRIEISDKGLTWKSKPYELKNNKQKIEKLRTKFEDAAQKYRLTFDGVEFKTSISLEIALVNPQRVYDRIERMKRCIHSIALVNPQVDG